MRTADRFCEHKQTWVRSVVGRSSLVEPSAGAGGGAEAWCGSVWTRGAGAAGGGASVCWSARGSLERWPGSGRVGSSDARTVSRPAVRVSASHGSAPLDKGLLAWVTLVFSPVLCTGSRTAGPQHSPRPPACWTRVFSVGEGAAPWRAGPRAPVSLTCASHTPSGATR